MAFFETACNLQIVTIVNQITLQRYGETKENFTTGVCSRNGRCIQPRRIQFYEF